MITKIEARLLFGGNYKEHLNAQECRAIIGIVEQIPEANIILDEDKVEYPNYCVDENDFNKCPQDCL